MKITLLVFFILIFSGCGIDKESASPQSSIGNSGNLDTTFDGDGYLTIDGSAGGSADDEIYGMVADSQGRIIAVGSSDNGVDLDIAVWRLTASGSLDTSFDSDGVFILDSAAGGGSTDIAYGVTVDSSDNIYVTGTSFSGADFDMVVFKLDSSGSLDTSFNSGGATPGIVVDHSAAGGNFNDQGTAITLDSSNNLFVAGFSFRTGVASDMALWKLSSSTGDFDNSFGTMGIVTQATPIGGEDANGNDVVVDSSGSVYVVGRAQSAINSGDMTVWKFDTLGALDTTFNGLGYYTQDGAAGFSGRDEATAAVLDDDENIYVTGFSQNSDGNNDMVLWKVLSATGFLDTTFDADGFVVSDVSDVIGGSSNDSGEDLIIDSDGQVVVIGTGNADMTVWRFASDGSPDEDFNVDGFFSHDSAAGGFGVDSGTCLVEGSNDALYLGGFSESASEGLDATFWRLK